MAQATSTATSQSGGQVIDAGIHHGLSGGVIAVIVIVAFVAWLIWGRKK